MVDANIIKKTQESLGKIIKKPPLTEKLLSKPPFRYLHDIISEVTKATGFLEGLYEGDELSAATIKDKESKIAYLQKAIDAVGLVIGSSLSARPQKIIAGAEPEKTNVFLQQLGKCASKGVNADVVDQVKSGEKPKKTESKDRLDKSKARRSSDNVPKSSSKVEQSKSRESTSKDRVPSKEKLRGAYKEVNKSGDKRRSRDEKDRDRGREDREKERSKERHARKAKEELKERKAKEKEELHDENPPAAERSERPPSPAEKPVTNGYHEPREGNQTASRLPRPSSAKGARRRAREDNDNDEERRSINDAVVTNTNVPIATGQRRERPTSARKAPPRLRKDEAENEEIEQKAGTGNAPMVNIITDSHKEDDEDDMYVNEEENQDTLPDLQNEQKPIVMDGSRTHGSLVQKIMESKKQYSTEQEDDAPKMNMAARQKEREFVKKEIDALRNGIQSLASSAAPMGKVLDYLQEDLDSMQKELELWRSENKYHEAAIKSEESYLEKSLEPLRDQLAELDTLINEQVNKISAMKCNIHNNDLKIEQMLSTMSFAPS